MFCRRILSLQKRYPLIHTIRTFLSNEYKCTTEWESRLSSPIMEKIKLDTFYYEIDQTFNQNGKASAIDIDLFVNKVNDDTHIDEIGDLIHRLRKTEETSNSLESTGHAVIRNFIDTNHIDELIQILQNPLEYGIFLDHYIANYIMNECLKKENYSAAARIATFLMLQEDFNNDLTKLFGLYSCYKYLSSNPQPFYPVEEKKDDDTEEIKVRVKYIRNEYFDDHFDLRNHLHLVGKTLIMIGKEMNENFNEISKNIELLGQVFYQKYDEALKTLKNSTSNIFYKEIIQNCIENLKSIQDIDDEKLNNFKNELEILLNDIAIKTDLKDVNFLNDIEKILKDWIKNNEEQEIKKQKEIYKLWNNIREQKFNDEIKRLQKIERLKQIEKLQNDMKNEEQKLWFFENEEQINLQIDSKKVTYPKRWFGKKKKPKVVDETYVPPEVTKQRS